MHTTAATTATTDSTDSIAIATATVVATDVHCTAVQALLFVVFNAIGVAYAASTAALLITQRCH